MKIPSKELKKKIKNAYWVCVNCGRKYGADPTRRTISIWHEDICSICGEIRSVTEFRDFGYAKEIK